MMVVMMMGRKRLFNAFYTLFHFAIDGVTLELNQLQFRASARLTYHPEYGRRQHE
jgi:hypothetical protein